MKTWSPLKIIVLVVVVAGVGAVGWYLGSPLFVDEVVEEDFPTAMPTPEELAAMTDDERARVRDAVMAAAAAEPHTAMNEPMPDAAPVALVSGMFKDIDIIHKGAGKATIYQLPDSTYLLRFEDFRVTNGPALHVLLAGHPDPTNTDEVHERYLDLGMLKGNVGSQNYAIPAGTDLADYQSVVIYCMPFRVIFSIATLAEEAAP